MLHSLSLVSLKKLAFLGLGLGLALLPSWAPAAPELGKKGTNPAPTGPQNGTLFAQSNKKVNTLSTDTVLAKLGDEVVTYGEFMSQMSLSTRQWRIFNSNPTTTHARMLIDELLAGKAQFAELQKTGGREWTDTLAFYHRAAVADAMRNELLRELGTESTGTLWREAYSELQNDINESEGEIQYRYIFVRSAGPEKDRQDAKRKKAEQALQRLNNGEDFVAVMRAQSEASQLTTEPLILSARSTNFDQKLKARLSAMAPGSHSELITNRAGYFIFQVLTNSTRPTAWPPYELAITSQPLRARIMSAAARPRTLNPLLKRRLETDHGKVVMPPSTETALANLSGNQDEAILAHGEQRVTAGQFNAWMKLRGEKPDVKQMGSHLDELAQQLLFVAEARKRGLEADFLREPLVTNTERRIAASFNQRRLEAQRPEPTDTLLRDWLKDNADSFSTGTLILDLCQLTLKPTTGSTDVPPIQVLEEARRLRGLLQDGQKATELAKDYHSAQLQLDATCYENIAESELPHRGVSTTPELANSDLPEPLRISSGYVVTQVLKRRNGRPTLEQAPNFIRAMWRQDWVNRANNQAREALIRKIDYTPALERMINELAAGSDGANGHAG